MTTIFGGQPLNFKNQIIGGDFGTNPWQRGTSFTTISNTLTYTADRFWALGGASSSISVSRQTDAPSGFANCLRFGRADANADTAAVNLGTVLTTERSLPLQGQNCVLSFWAKAGSGFSAASGNLAVVLGTGTGSDESAANFAAGSWTGYAANLSTTQAIGTTWVRYSFPVTIPATATQVGVKFGFTPVGTASSDYFQIEGVQLEIAQSVTPFERRPASIELEMCQRFAYVIGEPASGVAIGSGMATSTTNARITIPLPVSMRAAPTTTYTIGTLKANVAGSATTISALATATANTANNLNMDATTTGLTAGQASLLQGAGGTGSIVASAEL